MNGFHRLYRRTQRRCDVQCIVALGVLDLHCAAIASQQHGKHVPPEGLLS